MHVRVHVFVLVYMYLLYEPLSVSVHVNHLLLLHVVVSFLPIQVKKHTFGFLRFVYRYMYNYNCTGMNFNPFLEVISFFYSDSS